jgi:hypothetical protein
MIVTGVTNYLFQGTVCNATLCVGLSLQLFLPSYPPRYALAPSGMEHVSIEIRTGRETLIPYNT